MKRTYTMQRRLLEKIAEFEREGIKCGIDCLEMPVMDRIAVRPFRRAFAR